MKLAGKAVLVLSTEPSNPKKAKNLLHILSVFVQAQILQRTCRLPYLMLGSWWKGKCIILSLNSPVVDQERMIFPY